MTNIERRTIPLRVAVDHIQLERRVISRCSCGWTLESKTGMSSSFEWRMHFAGAVYDAAMEEFEGHDPAIILEEQTLNTDSYREDIPARGRVTFTVAPTDTKDGLTEMWDEYVKPYVGDSNEADDAHHIPLPRDIPGLEPNADGSVTVPDPSWTSDICAHEPPDIPGTVPLDYEWHGPAPDGSGPGGTT